MDCEFEKIQNILKQAKEIELTSDYHAYIFTNLDTERLELGDYIYDNFNVTGFRIVDTSNPEVSEYVKYWTQAFGHGRGRDHPLYVSYCLENLAFSVCILFEENVFIFQFLNDKIHSYVLFDIIVHFITQKLKNKHTFLKKYTN